MKSPLHFYIHDTNIVFSYAAAGLTFSQGKGECLEDEPADNDYAYPDLPPGAMYNAEHQCRLQFGVREASVCSPLHEVPQIVPVFKNYPLSQRSPLNQTSR